MSNQYYTFILNNDYSIIIIEHKSHYILHKTCPNRTFNISDRMTINQFIENITSQYKSNRFKCNLPVCVVINNNIATIKYINSIEECIFTKIGSNIYIQPYNTFYILKKKINLEFEAIKEEIVFSDSNEETTSIYTSSSNVTNSSIVNENEFNNIINKYHHKIIKKNIYNTPIFSPVRLINYKQDNMSEINKYLHLQVFIDSDNDYNDGDNEDNDCNDDIDDNEDNDINDVKHDDKVQSFILDINSSILKKK